MKKFMFIVAAALLAVGCNTSKTYVVEGQIEGHSGEVAIMNMDGDEVLATTTTEDGSFELSVESQTPIFASLALGGEPVMPLFIDGTPIRVEGNMENMQGFVAKGTPANDAFAAFNEQQWELLAGVMNGEAPEEELMLAFAKLQQLMNDSYVENADNLWGAYLFVSSKYHEMEAEQIMATIEAYPSDIRKMEEMVLVKEYAESLLKTAVGEPYINVTLPNVEGEEVSLKEVVEANKIVLLDFWASWCRPCMGEMPFLLEAYAKYHDKGFEIYGVSLDDNGDSWKKTIEQQGMKWVNVSTLGGWQTEAAKEYSVNSIPANFLINAKGEIIARNLRGEALAEALAEIFE